MPNGALILYAETNPQGCSGEVVRLQRAGTPQILFLGVFSSQEAVQQFFLSLARCADERQAYYLWV